MSVLSLAASLCGCSDTPAPAAIAQDPRQERRIEELLSHMTLEQKVGQMTQLTLDVLGRGESVYSSDMPFEFDEAMLDSVIHRYKVGSILNTAGFGTPLEVADWRRIIGRLQQEAVKATGIPLLYGVDQIHGTTYTIGGTLFPQGIAMGATFNPDLVREAARVTAYETRACGISWNFSPVLDLGRDARWPRQWESYSEDSYLASVMGRACTEGYQGDDPGHVGVEHVAACLKHYMGYGSPASGKDRTPSYISVQDMRERHFAPFLESVRAGALSVMVNSGLNNGMPFHANAEYLTRWLKEDLNWDGVIVTDWADIDNLHTRDRIAETPKEAVRMAINAGIDMSMVPYKLDFCHYLRELVEQGEVPMSRVDDAVRRILRLKMRLGLFEAPMGEDAYPDFGSETLADAAREAASECITLLKNNGGVLPLPQGVKVLVAGPNAHSMRTLNGGWTLSWQGEKTDVYASQYNTILEAVTARAGASNVTYVPGVTYKTTDPPSGSIPYWEENEPRIEQAVAAARGVDCILLCLGENSYCETPGNLSSLELSANQRALASALAATGKPVILILNEGRPRIIADIVPQMRAVVQCYLPGNYGGDALAAVLWGDINPSGRLPYTYPLAVNSLITYDYKPSENLDKMEGAYDYDAVASVQWPFGYGQSYTRFEYSDMEVLCPQFTAADTLEFRVTVRNVGDRAGKHSVLLFSSDRYASLTPDVRRLRAFTKIDLLPGQSRTLSFRLKASDLAFVGADGRWRLEKGSFMIQVGNQTVDIECLETKVWDSPNIG